MTALDTRPDHRPSSALKVLPWAAGLTAVGLALYQVATPGSPGASYDSALDWVREGLFCAYLLTSVAATHLAVVRDQAPRAARWLIGLGYGAIAVGVAVGMVLQDDPDWFMLLGGPGNLLAAAGFITWAVWGRRRRVLPLFAALLCGVGGLVAVFLAELGTSVLIGSFWFYLAAGAARTHHTRS